MGWAIWYVYFVASMLCTFAGILSVINWRANYAWLRYVRVNADWYKSFHEVNGVEVFWLIIVPWIYIPYAWFRWGKYQATATPDEVAEINKYLVVWHDHWYSS